MIGRNYWLVNCHHGVDARIHHRVMYAISSNGILAVPNSLSVQCAAVQGDLRALSKAGDI
jgi:hypothetical protein